VVLESQYWGNEVWIVLSGVCVFVCMAATDQGQLEEMVNELSLSLANVKHEQEYMEVRERLHRMSKSSCLVRSCLLHVFVCAHVHGHVCSDVVC